MWQRICLAKCAVKAPRSPLVDAHLVAGPVLLATLYTAHNATINTIRARCAIGSVYVWRAEGITQERELCEHWGGSLLAWQNGACVFE